MATTTTTAPTTNYHTGKFVKRLSLYDDECRQLLNDSYEYAKEEESNILQMHQEKFGNNRIPVLPPSSKRTNLQQQHPLTPLSSDNEIEEDEEDEEDVEESSSSSSEDDDDDGDDNSASESDDENRLTTVTEESKEEEDDDNDHDKATTNPNSGETNENGDTVGDKKKKKHKIKQSSKQQKRRDDTIQKQSSILPRIGFMLPTSSATEQQLLKTTQPEQCLMVFPSATLFPTPQTESQPLSTDKISPVMNLAQNLSPSSSSRPQYVVCLLLQSGRFAGGVFQNGKCVAHRTSTHYTVRKGQGKAQSSQDGKRRPKSMGSQLRRAGEQQTKDDVQSTLKEWKTQLPYIDEAALIFISCPKTMRSVLFFSHTDHHTATGGGGGSNNTNTNNNAAGNVVLSKDDDRIRKIPFDVGRPSFESVQVVHDILTSVDVCSVPKSVVGSILGKTDEQDSTDDKETKTISSKGKDNKNEKSSSDTTNESSTEAAAARLEKLQIDLPLTPLHEAARDGNLEVLLDLLNKMKAGDDKDVMATGEDGEDETSATRNAINSPAGYDCMTPLHYAAASTDHVDPVTAAACVSALLIQGSSADPTCQDARGRVPHYLASHDKVREAFRKARAMLGEDYCDWDTGAKVGPPLTEEDVAAKKEKEADKKRRKKARQKEKKAKERAQAQEMEERRKAEEEEKRLADEAKRVRDGLDPRKQGANVCDYCQKECKGKRRNQMFQRLDYKYCSTECVNSHKRELMAKAAMARFGG